MAAAVAPFVVSGGRAFGIRRFGMRAMVLTVRRGQWQVSAKLQSAVVQAVNMDGGAATLAQGSSQSPCAVDGAQLTVTDLDSLGTPPEFAN